MRKLFLLFFLAALSLPAFAAGGTCPTSSAYLEPVYGNTTQSLSTMGVTSCYFIDFVGGLDTNAGTTEGSPWKHAPGMTGCSNNCSSAVIAAGTGFIFKGGVTWDSTTEPWNLAKAGASGHPNYWGFDPTWFTNPSGTVNTTNSSVSLTRADASTVTCTSNCVTWVSGVHSGNVCTSGFIGTHSCNGTPNAVGDFITGLAGNTLTINGTGFTVSTCYTSTLCSLTTAPGTQTGVSFSYSLWTRPIMSCSGTCSNMLELNASFNNVDNLEFTDIFNNAACCSAVIQIVWSNVGGSSNNHVYNVYIHGGNVHSDGSHSSHFFNWSAAGNDTTATLHHDVADNSDFCTPATPTNITPNGPVCSITALEGGPRQIFMDYMGYFGGSIMVIDNAIDVHNLTLEWQGISPNNGTDHENMMESNGETTVGMVLYNNVVRHGWNGGVVDFQMAPQTGITSYAFNNVLPDMDGANMMQHYEATAPGTTYWFNNTAEGGPEENLAWNGNSNPPSGVCGRSSGPNQIANWINIHCVTTNNSGTNWIAPKASVNNFTTNLAQSLATATGQGYSNGNAALALQPSVVTGGTVGAGTNEVTLCNTIGTGATNNATVNANAKTACLADTSYGVAYDSVSHVITGVGRSATIARPTAGPWDVGAYQFKAGGPSFTAAPLIIPSSHSTNIAVTLTGTGTSWTSGTTFSIAGVTGATLVSKSNTSATAETLQITTGSGTGVLTITDTTDSISTTITVSTSDFLISPTTATPGDPGCTTACQTTITFTGTNTLWSADITAGNFTAATLFTITGGTGAAISGCVISSNTAATCALQYGSGGDITVTDNSITDTEVFTVSTPTLATVTTGTAGTPTAVTVLVTGSSYTCTGACATVTSEGVCWSTAAAPTTPCTSDGSVTPFNSTLTGLLPNTTYNYRAFATNSVGTAYGSTASFTTTAVLFVAGKGSTGSSATNTFTFSYTPTAANNAVVFAPFCHGASVPTTATLAASGWTITSLVNPTSNGNATGALFGAIAPNTSAATFTVEFFNGATPVPCASFYAYMLSEFTGNVSNGGTTTFPATGSSGATTGGCNQTAANVTPTSANNAVWFACYDAPTGANSPWVIATTDGGGGDRAAYQSLTGGSGVAQTPNFTGTTGSYSVLGVAISPVAASANAPTYLPVAGTYTGPQWVSLSTTSGNVICYSLVASPPPATDRSAGCLSGTLYTGPVLISGTGSIYAVAGGSPLSDSSVSSAAYVINAVAASGQAIAQGKINVQGGVSTR